VFMDSEYNQIDIEKDSLGDAVNYLEDGMTGEALFYEGRAISFEMPTTIVREVIYTEPAVRGDTSGKVLKPAKLATGWEVQVPAFCETGDRIEIDTRTNEYKRRVAPFHYSAAMIIRKANVRAGGAEPQTWRYYSDDGGLTQFGAYVETLQP